MGLGTVWNNYKVLIVMGSSLGLIHLGWHYLKNHPELRKPREELVQEPGIVAFVSASNTTTAPAAGKNK